MNKSEQFIAITSLSTVVGVWKGRGGKGGGAKEVARNRCNEGLPGPVQSKYLVDSNFRKYPENMESSPSFLKQGGVSELVSKRWMML